MPLRDPAPTLRRHFFFVAGYDPMDPAGHHRIFTREIARFAATWGVSAAGAAAPTPTATGALWEAQAEGPGWRTHTRFEVLAWDDLVRADWNRSRWSHVKGNARALLDMIATGTILRYFQFSRRYGIFFSLTYILLALFTLAAVGIAFFAQQVALPLGSLAASGLAALAGAGTFFGLMATIGARVRLKQSLNLAEFSVDFVRGRHPAIDARMQAFARRLLDVAAAGDVDEIVLAGHSLGAMHAVSLTALALAEDADFALRIPVRILTVGSTTAKFALHPAGARLRQAAQVVHDAGSVGWVEFQARDDIVSFYKVDPVTLRHAGNANGDRRPFVRQVTIRDMMTPETFARYRFDVMRLHCQFFLANDRRAPYDFYAFILAPIPFFTLVAQIEGPKAVFADDGALSPPVSPSSQDGA